MEKALNLPSGKYEIPLIIQDRMCNIDGSLSYLNSAVQPATDYHPMWAPEFFGNFILVNGMAWPNLDVEPRKYRFRIVNGSDARMYNLRLVDQRTGKIWPSVYQIGSDGGYLAMPVKLDQTPVGPDEAHDHSSKLFLAPAERTDVVIDFSGVPEGAKFVFTNDANSPFPGGDLPDQR